MAMKHGIACVTAHSKHLVAQPSAHTTYQYQYIFFHWSSFFIYSATNTFVVFVSIYTVHLHALVHPFLPPQFPPPWIHCVMSK